MKRLAILALLTAVTPGCVIGQGNGPQPSACPPQGAATAEKPSQICECPQKQANAEQRGSQTAPFIVKIIEANETHKEVESNKAPTPNNPSQPWGIADKIAAIASISAFLQFLALLATIWIMMRNAQRQLRAYVVVERGIVGNVANPPDGPGERVQTVARIMQPQSGPVAQITIKNTGQTPAYDVVHWGNMEIREFPLTSQLPTMPSPQGRFWSVLGPSVPEVKTLRIQQALSEEQIQGLRESRTAIYCHGEIHYRDAFKKTRVTHYRCMYCAVTGMEIGTSTDLTVCEEGNEAN